MRDPRVDPMPGDVVHTRGAALRVDRVVTSVAEPWVWFSVRPFGVRRRQFLRNWRKECEGGLIVKVSDA